MCLPVIVSTTKQHQTLQNILTAMQTQHVSSIELSITTTKLSDLNKLLTLCLYATKANHQTLRLQTTLT